MDMDEVQDHAGPAEENSPSSMWWPSDFMDKLGSVSLDSKDENLNAGEENNYNRHDRFASKSASQILWSTGVLSEPITNGFYSVIPEKSLKDLYNDIPTLDEIYAMGDESWRADAILVDAEKDKKLSMLKQLIVVLAKNLNSNLPAVVKKIAGLVSDVYKRQNLELSPARASLGETFNATENRGVQMLGQIKHGSCRHRAILFKVLADTVGLESRLMVGLPNEGQAECMDSYKHMSVLVVNNSMEFVVDLMRFPGQLIPRSTKAIYMTHISAAGESDSAEYDSCDSPLEPNSPLYGLSDRVEMDSSSHSEPNIATTVWRRSRRKVIAEQRTASSSIGLGKRSEYQKVLSENTRDKESTFQLKVLQSGYNGEPWELGPEHPSFRARARSMLGGDRQTFREFADDLATSRSEGASTSETRRIRRRSISITPEIGDDIVRAVRAMNETLKQNRLLREHEDYQSFSCSSNPTNTGSDHQKDESDFGHQNHGMMSGKYHSHLKEQLGSSKSMSLPSSPHEFRGQVYEKGANTDSKLCDKTVSTWNKVLELPMFQNQPLLAFQEWNIDYKELTVGTRVGIGFFGEVFRGIWNGTEVAIKVFLEQDLTAENMEDFCNEISILSRLRHPNVILFLGACTRPPHLSMVTEYMEMGSLYYLIHLSGQKKKISWRRRLKMLRDICRGLMCLHRMKIVHRDLKSANCLVNKHWTVKICDFGLSRIMTDTLSRDSSSAGTPEWMAPELIRNEPFTEKCDIFSLGVIMWELCTLNRPWDGVPPERVVYAVANERARLEIPEGPIGKLITDCWAEPQERPNCEDILTRLLDCEYSVC